MGRWNRSRCLVRSRGCSRRGRRGIRTQNSPGVGLNGTRTKRPCTPFEPKHSGGDPRTLGGDPRTPGKCRGRALFCVCHPARRLQEKAGRQERYKRWNRFGESTTCMAPAVARSRRVISARISLLMQEGRSRAEDSPMYTTLRPTNYLATAPIQSNGGGGLSCGDGRHLYSRAFPAACAGVFSALWALSCGSWASDSVF